MKRLLSIVIGITVLLSCSIAYSTDVTTSSVHYVAPDITMFKLSSVGDGETFTYNGPVGGWWVCATDTQDTTSLSVSQSVSGSTNTFTFNSDSASGSTTANFFIIK